MKKILLTSLAFILLATNAFAQTVYDIGAVGSGCDPCDYTDYATWESTVNGDITSGSGVVANLWAHPSGTCESGVLTIGGWINDSGSWITTRLEPSEVTSSNSGMYDTAKYCFTNTNGGIFSVQEPYVSFEDIQGKVTNTGTSNLGMIVVAVIVAGEVTFDRVVLWASDSNASSRVKGIYPTASTTVNITTRNSIFLHEGTTATNVDCSGYGLTGSTGSAVHKIQNNTFIGWRFGINLDSTGNVGDASNNIFQDYAAGVPYSQISAPTEIDYSVCKTGDCAAEDNEVIATLTFANAAGNNYHLDSTDTEVMGNGEDLSGSFTEDVDGETRPVAGWDRGADQFFASGSGGGTLLTIGSPKGIGIGAAIGAVINGTLNGTSIRQGRK